MATPQDIKLFRSRWENTGRLGDWSDDEVGCIVDVVARKHQGETFTALCELEGGIIDVLREAKAAGYAIIMPYTMEPKQTVVEFARHVVRDLVRRFPGRVAEDLYPQARQLALLTDDQIYKAIWANISSGEIILSPETTLMPALAVATSATS